MAGRVAARLSVRALQKAFGPTIALDALDLDAEAGSVHAVLGENGAGKSTLMGVLAGDIQPDAGALLLDGVPYAPRSPRDAQAAGVAMVHQELSLCPHLSVAANVMLGREPSRLALVDERALRARAAKALEAAAGAARARALGLDTLVRDLAPSERQLVEIARALASDGCRVLILDEPTSSLGRDDVRVLFDRIRALRAHGLLVLYISHFLEEVREIADRFTALRDGRTVGTGDARETKTLDLVTLIAGRPLTRVPALAGRPAAGGGHRSDDDGPEPRPVVLACDAVAGKDLPVRATLELRRGEVFGIAGLVGSGRTELLRVVFGLDPLASGKLVVLGREGPASPGTRLAQGVAMLSEDRKGEGLLLAMSIADNVTLSKLPPFVRASREEARAARWVSRMRIRCRDASQPVGDLSGGNQQKVALARLLEHDAQVVLLDEPTRGIDVGAKADVHELVRELAAAGRAILLVSDDLSELCALGDRIAVMQKGVLGAARPGSGWTEASLLAEAVGAPAKGAEKVA